MNKELRKEILKTMIVRCEIVTKKTEWYEYCLGFAKGFALSKNFEAGSFILENLQPIWTQFKGEGK